MSGATTDNEGSSFFLVVLFFSIHKERGYVVFGTISLLQICREIPPPPLNPLCLSSWHALKTRKQRTTEETATRALPMPALPNERGGRWCAMAPAMAANIVERWVLCIMHYQSGLASCITAGSLRAQLTGG